jgi:hypothetical protein
MKHMKFLLIMTVMISFALVSCKKTVTEPDETTIVGSWALSSAIVNWILTTNTNQIVKLPFSGNGEITVFGDFNSVLNGLFIYDSEPFSLAVVEIEYGRYISTMMVIDDDSHIAIVYAAGTEQTFEGTLNYTYDGVTLTITESILRDPNDANETVTVNGTMSFDTIDVPINSPTDIRISDVGSPYYPGFINAEFLDDGSFSMNYNYGNTTIFQNGTWEISDNVLTTVMVEDNNTVTEINDFIIIENELTITNSYDGCGESDDILNCLKNVEDSLGLTNGSLTKVQVETTLNFNKTS